MSAPSTAAAAAPAPAGPNEADIKAAFAKYDADSSGFLDKNEVFALSGDLGVLLDADELESAYKALDTSGDGKIQYDEFKAWISSAKVSEKGLAKLGLLKTKLYANFAAKFLAGVTAVTPDGKSGITIQVGDMKEVKASVEYSFKKTSNTVSGRPSFDVEYTINTTGGEANKFMGGLFDRIIKLIPAQYYVFATGGNKPTLTFPDSKTAVLSAKGLPFDPSILMMADMMEQKIGNAGLKLELGFSVTDIAANLDKWTVKDLLNFRVTYTGMLPPELQAMAGQGVPMLEAQGFKPEDIPGLADLLAGKTSITANVTSFVESLVAMAPPPIVSATLKDLILQHVSPELARLPKWNLHPKYCGVQAGLAFLFTLARDIHTVGGIKLTAPKYEVAVQMETKDGLIDSYKLFSQIADLAFAEALKKADGKPSSPWYAALDEADMCPGDADMFPGDADMCPATLGDAV